MIGAVPSILTDIGIIAGVFTAVAAAMAVLWKTPPMRWLRRHIGESFGQWMRDQVQEANAEHNEYVRYHLGPNGTTKPIHKRLCDVEEAVSGAPVPVLPFVDWGGPYDDGDDHG